MRRWTAIVLGIVMSSAAGSASALHVHAYTDHDHAEHHHGPAVHDHDVPDAADADGTVRLKACAPGRHAIGFVFVCGGAPHSPSLDVGSVSPAIARPCPSSPRAVHVRDIRVHGPPSANETSPRAPPLIFSA